MTSSLSRELLFLDMWEKDIIAPIPARIGVVKTQEISVKIFCLLEFFWKPFNSSALAVKNLKKLLCWIYFLFREATGLVLQSLVHTKSWSFFVLYSARSAVLWNWQITTQNFKPRRLLCFIISLFLFFLLKNL